MAAVSDKHKARTVELLDRRGQGHGRYLVFTSAGDKSNLKRWIKGRKNFDLWITYYGEHSGRYADSADIYNERKGSKFQNLKFAYDTWPDVLDGYDAVMVMDDDIVIRARNLSALFEIREELDLWILQPAFSPLGKFFFPITRVQWASELRYTDFVEMACPLFRKDKLDAFMCVYDPILAGFGTEWWFLDVLGPELEGRVAVIDRISCINPHDRSKGGTREINRLQSQALREAAWRQVRRKYGITIEEHAQHEFRVVQRPLAWRWLFRLRHIAIEGYLRARSMAAPLRRRVESWRQHGQRVESAGSR